MNELINPKDVCRTAPATPGLLNARKGSMLLQDPSDASFTPLKNPPFFQPSPSPLLQKISCTFLTVLMF